MKIYYAVEKNWIFIDFFFRADFFFVGACFFYVLFLTCIGMYVAVTQSPILTFELEQVCMQYLRFLNCCII